MKPKTFRPWQIRQWLGLDEKGKPKRTNLPPSLNTRQRGRQACRILAYQQVNEQFGLEPRRARRGIARVWAKKAYQQYREAA